MPGGRGKINGSDGKQFSKDYQPVKKRGVSLVTKLKSLLNEEPEIATSIMNKLLEKAKQGDLKAVEMVMDRIDGKVVQPTEKVKEKPAGRKNFVDFQDDE